MSNIYACTSLTGGGSGALDSIDGSLLSDLDAAVVTTADGVYHYSLDADFGAAESSPDVISPDSNAGTKRWVLVSGTGSGDVSATSNLTDNAVVRGDGGAKGVQTSTVLVSDDGEMTNPSQPCFSAVLSSSQSNVTGDGTIYNITGAIFTEIFDQGNNLSDGTFTAPVSGRYLFNILVALDGWDGTHDGLRVQCVTSNGTFDVAYLDGNNVQYNTYYRITFALLVDMDINDTVYWNVRVSTSTKTITLSSTTTLMGKLIC